MISPELLRRYPFFGFMSDEQLRKLAMAADEEAVRAGVTLLEEGKPADTLFFLLEGSIELLYRVGESRKPETMRELPVGNINPGEPFGISAVIEPNVLTASVRANMDCRVIRIPAASIQKLCDEDKDFALGLMDQFASVAIQRLNATRVQLAAAWAPTLVK